ncbi:hypothetical protein [Microbulbifer epialgicus]|uniref:Uncharacterized protein n=1 Tax=Microbulbifer epialgicus TaxID=393907 RepID=A0ABV4P7K5_9GAMM
MESKSELPKPLNPIFGNILLTAAAAFTIAIALVDGSKAADTVNAKACKNALMIVATRPSSVEVNQVKSRRSEMSSDDALKWQRLRGTSPSTLKWIEGEIANKPMERSFISIDYTATTSLIGDYRSEFLCTFVKNAFDSEVLDTITFQNKDYKFHDIFGIGDERPDSVDITGEVEHNLIVDRVVHIISSITPL